MEDLATWLEPLRAAGPLVALPAFLLGVATGAGAAWGLRRRAAAPTAGHAAPSRRPGRDEPPAGQAELQRLQERYRRMVEQSPDAIWLCVDARIEMVNRACVGLLGAPDEAHVIGLDPADVLPDAWGALRDSALAAAGGAVQRECSLRRLDGSLRDVEVSAASVPDHGHAAVQLVIRDVSDRHAAEAALKQQRDELRRLSAQLTHAREEERRHLARELHDEVGQQLTAIRIGLGSLRQDSGGLTRQRLHELIAHVDTLVAALRRIAADLRPAMLDDLGLEAALEWLAKEWGTRTGLAIRLQVEPMDEELSDTARISVYRIVQEALTNVARHAHAGSAGVSLQHEQGHLRIVVTDDGVGLSPGATDKHQSHGLRGIRERARSLGGHADIVNRAIGGSQLTVVLPLARIDSGLGELQ